MSACLINACSTIARREILSVFFYCIDLIFGRKSSVKNYLTLFQTSLNLNCVQYGKDWICLWYVVLIGCIWRWTKQSMLYWVPTTIGSTMNMVGGFWNRSNLLGIINIIKEEERYPEIISRKIQLHLTNKMVVKNLYLLKMLWYRRCEHWL